MTARSHHHAAAATATAPRWRIDGNRAVSVDGATATVHFPRPDEGITIVDAARPEVAMHLLGLSLAERPPTDAWVRGDDLVAVYEPDDPRFLRVTAMWRHRPTGSPDVRGWELIASAQTSLLESDAAMVAVSSLPAREVLVADAEGRGWRPHDASSPLPAGCPAVLVRCDDAVSGLVAVHPLDLRRVTLLPGPDGGLLRIACRLFPNVVEKGVLLRGRTLAAVGPAAGDTVWAEALSAEFRRSPPVLTA